MSSKLGNVIYAEKLQYAKLAKLSLVEDPLRDFESNESNESNEILDKVKKYKKAQIAMTVNFAPTNKVPTQELLDARGIQKTPDDFYESGLAYYRELTTGAAVFVDIYPEDKKNLYIATATHLVHRQTSYPDAEFRLDYDLRDKGQPEIKSLYYPLFSVDSIDENTDISDFSLPYAELNSVCNNIIMVLSNGKVLTINQYKSCLYRWNIPSDCAILKIPIDQIDAPEDFDIDIDIVKLKFASKCSIGEQVIKFGFTLYDHNSYSTGYVRDNCWYSIYPQSPGHEGVIMLTSNETNAGDSGGAVINMNGEILGIGSYLHFSDPNRTFATMCQTYKKFQLLLEVPSNKLTQVGRYKGTLMSITFPASQSLNNRYGLGTDPITLYPTLRDNNHQFNSSFFNYWPNKSNNISPDGEQLYYNELVGACCTLTQYLANPYDQTLEEGEGGVQPALKDIFVNWEFYSKTYEYKYLPLPIQNVVKIDTLDEKNEIINSSEGPFINYGDEDSNHILDEIYFGKANKVKLYFIDFMSNDRTERRYTVVLDCTDDIRIKSAAGGQRLDKTVSTNNILLNNESIVLGQIF
jgi:hypothetical protein